MLYDSNTRISKLLQYLYPCISIHYVVVRKLLALYLDRAADAWLIKLIRYIECCILIRVLAVPHVLLLRISKDNFLWKGLLGKIMVYCRIIGRCYLESLHSQLFSLLAAYVTFT